MGGGLGQHVGAPSGEPTEAAPTPLLGILFPWSQRMVLAHTDVGESEESGRG